MYCILWSSAMCYSRFGAQCNCSDDTIVGVSARRVDLSPFLFAEYDEEWLCPFSTNILVLFLVGKDGLGSAVRSSPESIFFTGASVHPKYPLVANPLILQCYLICISVVSDVVTSVIMLVYILEPTSRHILVLFLFQNGPERVTRTRNRKPEWLERTSIADVTARRDIISDDVSMEEQCSAPTWRSGHDYEPERPEIECVEHL
jgi:hypothetical protein